MFGGIEFYSPRKRRLIKRFVHEQYRLINEYPIIESVDCIHKDATVIGVKLTNGRILTYVEK